MLTDITARIGVRLTGDEARPGADEVEEVAREVSDRICMRLGVAELPALAESIAVDAAVKVMRRKFYEGVQSESEGQTGSVSTSFFESVLGEYEAEIAGLRASLSASPEALTRSKVRFL